MLVKKHTLGATKVASGESLRKFHLKVQLGIGSSAITLGFNLKGDINGSNVIRRS